MILNGGVLSISRNGFEAFGDYVLSFTAIGQGLINLIQIILGDGGFISVGAASALRIGMTGILAIISLIWVFHRNFKLGFGTFLAVCLLLVYSYCLFPDNYNSISSNGIKLTILSCIPIFLSMALIRDVRIFHKVCDFVFKCCAFFGIFYLFLFIIGHLPNMEARYNMSFGYDLMLPAMYFLYKGSRKWTVLSILLVIIIIFLGSRGPLIPWGLYFLWLKIIRGSNKAKVMAFVSVIVCIMLFPVVVEILSSYGLAPRTLMLIMEGQATNDSGRDQLYGLIWNAIMERPFLGYGLFGDRYFIPGGFYCHNIILEMCTDFGLIVTALLLFFGISFCTRIYFTKNQQDKTKQIFILLTLATCIPLFLSGSYLIDFRLPLMLGFLYNTYHDNIYFINPGNPIQDNKDSQISLSG